MYSIQYRDLGVKDYKETWDYQEELHGAIVKQKLVNQKLDPAMQKPTEDYVLFVEHPHVYTLGKSGDAHNLLIQENYLRSIGATFYKINRGGDITYHGPGQLVGYPIIDLEHYGLSVKNYIHLLEDAIIELLAAFFEIKASHMDGATGVWLDAQTPGRARKICAIGVRISRYVSMHGFALNVSTDLEYFRHINPCGFIDKGVTSIEKEIGEKPDMQKIKDFLFHSIQSKLNALANA
ncbi:MAG: lipoyl(octanoyl) transferase LipB [Bacteroidota bacterium]